MRLARGDLPRRARRSLAGRAPGELPGSKGVTERALEETTEVESQDEAAVLAVRVSRDARPEPRDAWKSLARIAAVFVVLMGLSIVFREQLAPLGKAFVDRFGVAGLGLGAFLADGLHFPVPPQFYLATAIASGAPQVVPVVVIAIGSILGGLVAFTGGRLAARGGLAATQFRAVTRVGTLLQKQGAGLVGVATFAPVPYWLLCVSAGLFRLPLRAYAIIGICRIPKLLFFYALIALAWCGGG